MVKLLYKRGLNLQYDIIWYQILFPIMNKYGNGKRLPSLIFCLFIYCSHKCLDLFDTLLLIHTYIIFRQKYIR